MRHELIRDRDGERTFLVVFETGDEAVDGLQRFAREHDVAGARLTAIGAVEEAVLAFWDWESKAYLDVPVREQAEVASMVGNVALAPDGEARKVHAHAVLGLRDGSARAGHVQRLRVRPTLEAFLTESPEPLRRERDETTGLPLLRP